MFTYGAGTVNVFTKIHVRVAELQNRLKNKTLILLLII